MSTVCTCGYNRFDYAQRDNLTISWCLTKRKITIAEDKNLCASVVKKLEIVSR